MTGNCRTQWTLNTTYTNCDPEFIIRKIPQLMNRLKYIKSSELEWYDYYDDKGSYESKEIWDRERFDLTKEADQSRLAHMVKKFEQEYTNGDVILCLHVQKEGDMLSRLYTFKFTYKVDDDGC